MAASKLTLAIMAFLLVIYTADAATIKLFYYKDGMRGWKGGYQSMQQCERAAESNRLSPGQYYCAGSQDYDLERRLGWRQ